jgi:hypothetical protein
VAQWIRHQFTQLFGLPLRRGPTHVELGIGGSIPPRVDVILGACDGDGASSDSQGGCCIHGDLCEPGSHTSFLSGWSICAHPTGEQLGHELVHGCTGIQTESGIQVASHALQAHVHT